MHFLPHFSYRIDTLISQQMESAQMLSAVVTLATAAASLALCSQRPHRCQKFSLIAL
jgi:hypothetical protein